MFLPKRDADTTPLGYTVRWFEQDEIQQFYEGQPYPNAFCTAFDPKRPDMLAVAAYDNGEIVRMAGCSADTPLLWQMALMLAEATKGGVLARHWF